MTSFSQIDYTKWTFGFHSLIIHLYLSICSSSCPTFLWPLPCRYMGVLLVKNLPASWGDGKDMGSVPGSGRFPGVGNLLWYSCLEHPMDRGAGQSIVHGATESQTQLSDWAYTHTYRCVVLDSVLRIERWLRQVLPLGPSQGPQGGWSW